MRELTLARLKNTDFPKHYTEFIKSNDINDNQKQIMLQLAILFLNSLNDDVKKLGYRIILKYCNKTGDYVPLYDVAINEGFIPISKYLEMNQYKDSGKQEQFFFGFQSAFEENFKKGNIYLTEEQLQLNKFFSENNDKSIAVVAPTSYGKSELIMNLIDNNDDCNICIIVPTKSLLAQTKRRIINHKNYDRKRKIVTHPEMYNSNDHNFIAVLTQERLLRLLQNDKELLFDQVVIDEAHNLLYKDSRSELLAVSLIILNKRNPKYRVKYLTPFLLDTRNLDISFLSLGHNEFKITENIKTENYLYYDFTLNSGLLQYDQYLNNHIMIDKRNYRSDIELIIEKSSKKNVIYLNRPIHIEKLTNALMEHKEELVNSQIEKAIEDISSYIHVEYSLIEALRKGIVYHHGSVPDNIRLYIEHLFSTILGINYVITTSTLLEGVNIPADTLFLLDYKKGLSKLSHAQFKNLVGRVSRFGEIFDENIGSIKKLEPCIYIIKSDYMQSKANIIKFLQETARVDRKYKDQTGNVLLENTEITDSNIEKFEEAIQFIENQEPGTIQDENILRVSTEVGEICYKNSIIEINILKHEQAIQSYVETMRNEGIIIDSPKNVLEHVVSMFIEKVPDEDKYCNLKRLLEKPARNFYTMFLHWKIRQASYNEMVTSFVNYWNSLIDKGKDTIIYVGKWGDVIKDSPNGERRGYRPLWVDISTKSRIQLINIAIVRIKEEQDFLENVLMKFIEALYDLELIESKIYSLIKYGTENESLITIIKNGIGLQTARLILKQYNQYININNIDNTIFINKSIIDVMKGNNENEIIIYEVMCNIGL